MRIKNTVKLAITVGVITAVVLTGCFIITLVNQPSNAAVGEQITAVVTVSVEGQSDANPHYGIAGFLIPDDWTIDTVYFSGGYSDYCTYLHPDSSDAEPGGQVDYWTDSLEAHYPAGTGMKWVVYQSSKSHLTLVDTLDVMLTVKMTISNTQGNYNLGYFVSDAALDFSDPTYYDVSLNNAITISGVVPVELTSFNASAAKEGISLAWATATETNNKGFEIEKSIDNKIFNRIGFIEGKGTTAEKNSYQFVDKQPGNEKCYYRLKQIDLDGTFKYSKTIDVDYSVPNEFSISQNYPNPFNPSTSIQFGLPVEARVIVTLYNTLGERVLVLANREFTAGRHVLNMNGGNLSSGTYIYSISAEGIDGSKFMQTKKMILMK